MPTDSSPALWWVRRDFRLADNPALRAAVDDELAQRQVTPGSLPEDMDARYEAVNAALRDSRAAGDRSGMRSS